MNLDGLIKFGYDTLGFNKAEVLILFFLIYLFRILVNKYKSNKESNLENLNIVITELEKENQKNHGFIIEQVFRKKFGVLIDYQIIKFFLNSKTPSRDLYDYMSGKIYLSFDDNYRSIKFRNAYTKNKLKVKRVLHLIFYALSASVFLFSIKLLALNENPSYWDLYINFVLLITSFMVMIVCVSDGSNQSPAIRLYEKYNNIDNN